MKYLYFVDAQNVRNIKFPLVFRGLITVGTDGQSSKIRAANDASHIFSVLR